MKRVREHYRLTAKPLGPMMENLLEPAMRGRGFLGTALLSAWQEVIEPGLKLEAKPFRMVGNRRGKAGPEAGGRVLEVRCSEGAYLMLFYQKPLLIERLNQHLGRAFLADIKFVKEKTAGEPREAPTKKTASSPLTALPAGDLDDALGRLRKLRKSRRAGNS